MYNNEQVKTLMSLVNSLKYIDISSKDLNDLILNIKQLIWNTPMVKNNDLNDDYCNELVNKGVTTLFDLYTMLHNLPSYTDTYHILVQVNNTYHTILALDNLVSKYKIANLKLHHIKRKLNTIKAKDMTNIMQVRKLRTLISIMIRLGGEEYFKNANTYQFGKTTPVFTEDTYVLNPNRYPTNITICKDFKLVILHTTLKDK